MKTPKLKYYYHAMTAAEYHEFTSTRSIKVTATIQYDIQTMTAQGRTHVILTGAAVSCDQEFRDRTRTWAPVYVLRIPADCVTRDHLTPVPGSILIYQYRACLHIPHCGVELIELDPQTQPQKNNITLPI